MQLQYYTFLNGERKINLAAMNDADAWSMAFELAPKADSLTKLPEYDRTQFTPDIVYAGETIH